MLRKLKNYIKGWWKRHVIDDNPYGGQLLEKQMHIPKTSAIVELLRNEL